MVLHLKDPEGPDLRARITVFGVGGAGGNAVNNMIEKQLAGVEFIAGNTDAQALEGSQAARKLQLGLNTTQGLGAGSKPEIGFSAAEEAIEDIVEALTGSHMCFITAGMGGGTGTGAAPVVARAAREMGILTVGVVTKPFHFEGSRRMQIAEEGVLAMQEVVDTLIVIPNQNLFQIASERTTFVEAFQMADDVLYQGVQGVTDLMVRPGMINLDFADVRSVMEEMGKAMMGTGEADGDNRAQDAAEKAIANPLLDEVSLKGAKGVLINITGGYDLTLFEMDEAANRIKAEVDPNALIKFGSAIDPEMEGRMRVSVVATGIDAELSRRLREEDEAAARPVKRPVATDPEMLTAARGNAKRPFQVRRSAPAAPAAAAAVAVAPAPEPVEEAPEPAAPAATAAVVEMEPQPEPQVAEPAAPVATERETAEAEARMTRAEEIRVRAEGVRQRALEARARRAQAPKPEPVEVLDDTIDDDAMYELDEASLDGEEVSEAPRSFVDRQIARRSEPARAAERAPEPRETREPARAASREPLGEPAEEQRQSLFAINRLISRVAGHGPAQGQQPREVRSEPRLDPRHERLERQERQEPRVDSADLGDDDPEGDIPAFLRRQAN